MFINLINFSKNIFYIQTEGIQRYDSDEIISLPNPIIEEGNIIETNI